MKMTVERSKRRCFFNFYREICFEKFVDSNFVFNAGKGCSNASDLLGDTLQVLLYMTVIPVTLCHLPPALGKAKKLH